MAADAWVAVVWPVVALQFREYSGLGHGMSFLAGAVFGGRDFSVSGIFRAGGIFGVDEIFRVDAILGRAILSFARD